MDVELVAATEVRPVGKNLCDAARAALFAEQRIVVGRPVSGVDVGVGDGGCNFHTAIPFSWTDIAA